MNSSSCTTSAPDCQLVLRFVVSQQSGLQLAALSSGKQLLGGGPWAQPSEDEFEGKTDKL